MAKLSFIDQLDDRQIEYADKIRAKAVEMGIPPALAVSIAYHESRLNPDAPRGKSGEFGIMQVMPATGKGMGFTNKDLADPDKNIEAGLKYLKQNLDAFGGDPKMATVGYNAGTDSPFFSGGDLPKTTEAYVKAMKGYGAYDEAAEPAQQAATTEGEMVAVEKPPEEPPEKDLSGADKAARFLFGGIGAGAGTAVAGTQAGVNALDNRAVNLAGKTEAAKIAAQRAAGQVPPTPTPTPPVGSTIMRQPIPSGGPDAGRLAAGQTGTMPYNYGKAAGLTDIEAGRALDMTKQAGGVHDLTTQRREGMNRVNQIAPNQFIENPRYGGLLTPDQSVGGGPRQSFVVQPPSAPGAPSALTQLPPRQSIPTTPFAPKAASGLESVTNMFKGMIQPVSTAARTVGKYILPPLAGLSAGLDVADVAHEYDKPERDYTKMGLKAASGVGGALSMFPASAPVGIPLSLGASGIQAYRENPDWLRKKMEGSANIPLLNEMTGPLP
jgi:hypothetical protein